MNIDIDMDMVLKKYNQRQEQRDKHQGHVQGRWR